MSRNLTDLAPCGIISFSEEGIIISANGFCENILEFEKGSLTGVSIEDLLTVSGRIFHQTHIYPLLKLHKKVDEIFVTYKTKKGNSVPVVMNASLEQDSKVIICSFIPVYNRRKYEDEILAAKKVATEALEKNLDLERIRKQLTDQQKLSDQQISRLYFQNQELLQLSDIVSHDLQEPVRKLAVFSDKLKTVSMNGEDAAYSLSVIHRSAIRIKALLTNLQDYLGITKMAGSEGVDLNSLSEEILSSLKIQFPHIKLSAYTELLPVIRGNRSQLGVMLRHIYTNAFEHGNSGDDLQLNVAVVLTKENLFTSLDKYEYVDFVKIIISDKGKGFDAGMNEYIFNIAKKLDLNSSSVGFGLAICKRIAENHKGTVKVRNEPGQGASFEIMLPLNLENFA